MVFFSGKSTIFPYQLHPNSRQSMKTNGNEKSGKPTPRRVPLHPPGPGGPGGIEWELRERIKELNCLYRISQLAESVSLDLDEILEGVVKVLPSSWQYPEVASAGITFLDRLFTSPGFRLTPWAQTAPISVHGEPSGWVTVCYHEERPFAHEGPFLREERILLDAVAGRIGAIAMRHAAERELTEANHQLRLERQTLQDTNAALKTVLARIEEEKREIRRDIRQNLEKVVLPIVRQVHLAVPRDRRPLVELLGASLEEIASPFIGSLEGGHPSLTPTEVQICSMIRGGMRTKEIADLRGISPATVHRHRERIRRKLGLVRSQANLTTFLRTTGGSEKKGGGGEEPPSGTANGTPSGTPSGKGARGRKRASRSSTSGGKAPNRS